MLQHQLVRSTVLSQVSQVTVNSVTPKAEVKKACRSNINFLSLCGKVHPWGLFVLHNRLQVMRMFNLLMIDWDPAAEGEELDGHYTIRSKEEVFTILEERVAQHPEELWRVYETPSGGIHAFLLSHKYTPKQGYDLLTEMKGDTLYRDICIQSGKWSARIRPKPGREGDFVARYICSYGKGNPLEDHLKTIGIHDSFLPN